MYFELAVALATWYNLFKIQEDTNLWEAIR